MKPKNGSGKVGKGTTKGQSIFGIGDEHRKWGYVNKDGTETVEAWKCAEGCPVRMLDEMSGDLHHGPRRNNRIAYGQGPTYFQIKKHGNEYPDSGGASRFFYCAKASRSERGKDNKHPTVKPLKLMEYLCRLTRMPEGGVVLDPFFGSGTTGLACERLGRRWLGIEKEGETCRTAAGRLNQPAQRKLMYG